MYTCMYIYQPVEEKIYANFYSGCGAVLHFCEMFSTLEGADSQKIFREYVFSSFLVKTDMQKHNPLKS